MTDTLIYEDAEGHKVGTRRNMNQVAEFGLFIAMEKDSRGKLGIE